MGRATVTCLEEFSRGTEAKSREERRREEPQSRARKSSREGPRDREEQPEREPQSRAKRGYRDEREPSPEEERAEGQRGRPEGRLKRPTPPREESEEDVLEPDAEEREECTPRGDDLPEGKTQGAQARPEGSREPLALKQRTPAPRGAVVASKRKDKMRRQGTGRQEKGTRQEVVAVAVPVTGTREKSSRQEVAERVAPAAEAVGPKWQNKPRRGP